MELLFLMFLVGCFQAMHAQNCSFTDDLCGYSNGGSDQLQWMMTRDTDPDATVPNFVFVDITAPERIPLATLTSPPVSKQTGLSYRFSFDYRVRGDHTLHVRASGSGGGGWEHTGDTNEWENAMLVLAPPTDPFSILIFADIGTLTVLSRIHISNLYLTSVANSNCDPSPCLNGGECYDLGSDQGPLCLCINGYRGDTCELPPTTPPPPTTPELPTTSPEATTVLLTTEEPTTFDPTTFNPTTFNPTTMNPTTFNPTTVNPTTADPSTFNPTTFDIPTGQTVTTGGPTTFQLTTQGASTVPLTTVDTTTDEQTTQNLTTVEVTTNAMTTVQATTQISPFTDNGTTEDTSNMSTDQPTTESYETGSITSGQETPEATTAAELTTAERQPTDAATDMTEATGTTEESTNTEVPDITGNTEPTEQEGTDITTSELATDSLTEGPETTASQITEESTQKTEGEMTTRIPPTTSSGDTGASGGTPDVTTGLIIGLCLAVALLLVLLAFTLAYYCTHRDRYGVSEGPTENGNATPMTTMKPGTSRNAQVYENPYVTAATPTTERSTQTSLSAINV